MKRSISCRLDGADVIQTTTYHEDDGSLHRESVQRLGARDTVLEHLEAEVTKATRDRDGMASPKPAKPPAAGDGKPGTEDVFWLNGRTVYRTEISRDAKGKLTSERTEPLGIWQDRLSNAEERLGELTEMRNAVRDAK